jgi:hypothetical protein
MNRTECLLKIQDGLRRNNTSPAGFWGANGNDTVNPVITLQYCYEQCSGQRRWYGDIGQRYFTWLLPVVLLLANLGVSPLNRWVLSELMLLVGDPITSFWSLLTKLEAWRSCCKLSRRPSLGNLNQDAKELGTVLIAVEELVGLETDTVSELLSILLQSPRGVAISQNQLLLTLANHPNRVNITQALRDTALKLSRGRVDDIPRTVFAVLIYMLSLTAAFVTVLGGGNDSPPGGRIGTAMLLTWLIPAVLLSNTICHFSSRETCYETMKALDRICYRLSSNHQAQARIHNPATKLQNLLVDSRDFYNNQPWSGAIYIYSPKELSWFRQLSGYRQLIIFILSMLPVLTSSICGSAILWYTPPNGLNCRGIMLIMISLTWFVSAFITWATRRMCNRDVSLPTHWKFWQSDSWQSSTTLTLKRHWYLMCWKNGFVAVPSTLMIFLSSAGLFNTCFCWSSSFTWGADAHIPLNAAVQFEQNDKTLYPLVAGLCVLVQFCIFVLALLFWFPGWRMAKWTDRDRRRVW